MMKLVLLIVYLLSFIPSEPSGNTRRPKTTTKIPTVKLLQVGSFHGDEVDRKDTSLQWFGLFKTKTGFELKKVRVKIRYTKDVVLDDEDGGYTGKLVKINDKREPLMLIGGIDSLKGGNIPGRSYPSGRFLACGKKQIHHLNGINYYIQASGICKSIVQGNEVLIDRAEHYKVVLINKNLGQKQVLFKDENVNGDYEGPSLFWTGDIDGDGKLDVIFDECGNDGHEFALFLSSYAAKGKLVRKMVEWRTTGC